MMQLTPNHPFGTHCSFGVWGQPLAGQKIYLAFGKGVIFHREQTVLCKAEKSKSDEEAGATDGTDGTDEEAGATDGTDGTDEDEEETVDLTFKQYAKPAIVTTECCGGAVAKSDFPICVFANVPQTAKGSLKVAETQVSLLIPLWYLDVEDFDGEIRLSSVLDMRGSASLVFKELGDPSDKDEDDEDDEGESETCSEEEKGVGEDALGEDTFDSGDLPADEGETGAGGGKTGDDDSKDACENEEQTEEEKKAEEAKKTEEEKKEEEESAAEEAKIGSSGSGAKVIYCKPDMKTFKAFEKIDEDTFYSALEGGGAKDFELQGLSEDAYATKAEAEASSSAGTSDSSAGATGATGGTT